MNTNQQKKDVAEVATRHGILALEAGLEILRDDFPRLVEVKCRACLPWEPGEAGMIPE